MRKILVYLSICLNLIRFTDSNESALKIKQRNSIVNSLSQPLSSFFFQLPTHEQITELIVKADSGGLVQIVQILNVESPLQCYQTLSFFFQLFGKIHITLEQKRVDYAIKQRTITLAEKQIQKLKDQIESLNGWQEVLRISQNKMELMDRLDNLIKLYNLYNNVQIEIEPQKAKIKGYQQQISNIEYRTNIQRNNLQEQSLKMVQIETNIQRLESELKEEKQKYIKSKNKITGLKNLINGYEIKIATIKNIIANVQRGITSLKNKAVNLRQSYSKAEIEAQRLKQEILSLQQRQDKLSKAITQYQDKIFEEEKKLEYHALKNIENGIKALESILPGISEQIENKYYQCYSKDGSLMISRTINNVTLYFFQATNFKTYLSQIYLNTIVPNYETIFLLGKIKIFSDEWVESYGSPLYSYQSIGIINNNITCMNTDNIDYGYGKITLIKNSIITVKTNKHLELNLLIVPCSCLESNIKKPHTNQTIFWKGTTVDKPNYFQLLWATII